MWSERSICGDNLPMHDIGQAFLTRSLDQLRYAKGVAERAIAQVPEEALYARDAEENNSIATTMQHIAGNMRSRWTHFLDEDGEKAWRHRDQEFEDQDLDHAALMERWESAWTLTLDTIGALTVDDLMKPTRIRGQEDVALQRILRQVAHYSYHVGQIVHMARRIAGPAWRSLSVPRGESDAYNASLGYTPTP